jgi:uncharacterized protein (DUF885 family)
VRASIAALGLMVALGALVQTEAGAAPGPADPALRALGEEYLQRTLERDPAWATSLGLHERDGQLPPVTQATLAEDAAWLRGFERRLLGLDAGALSFGVRLDRDLLLARVRARLLDLGETRPFERDPGAYVPLVAGSVQAVLERDFAPECERARLAASRLRQVPEVLRAARINLRAPRRLATQVAIARYEGVLRFYRVEAPALIPACRDPQALAELAEADSLAVGAVEEFLAYLREDVLPRADTTLALGRELLGRKLLAEEMLAAPPETLLAESRDAIARTRAEMESLAASIRPGTGAAALLDELGRGRPTADSLLAWMHDPLERVRQFARAQGLLGSPASERTRVRPMPAFARELELARSEPPGALEHASAELLLDVTPAASDWTAPRRADYLALFNRYCCEVLAMRLASPGRAAQRAALRRNPSRLRRTLESRACVDGWQAYTAQAMLEAGYAATEPRCRMARLWLDLVAECRLAVALQLHLGDLTLGQAAGFLREQAWLPEVHAEREALGAALDPTGALEALGRRRIQALYDEARGVPGARFRPGDARDPFLRSGALPLPLAREAVLHALGSGATR